MPEAVIVDAVRPRSAARTRARWRACAPTTWPRSRSARSSSATRSVDFAAIDDVCMGCGFQWRAGLQRRPQRALLAGHRPPRPGDHRQPLLRLLAAGDADGVPRDRARARASVRRRRRRGGLARRRAARAFEPAPAARRLRGPVVQRLHPDGADRRERRRALQRHAARRRTSGQRSPSSAPSRRAKRPLRRRDRPGRRHARRAPRSRATTARGPAHGREAARELKPVFKPGRHGHGRQRVPAQRRRRRGAGDVGGEGATSSA